MKKKILAVMLAAAMVIPMAACGGSNESASTDSAATEEAAPAEEAAEPAAEPAADGGGKVLNIYCWNEEFKSRVTDHYSAYTEVDATHGKIGDVDVVWNITPSDDNAYQNNLDQTLLNQESAAADDKIDIFLVEADYASKYTDTDYTMALSDLGISDSDLSDQYEYTQTIAKDSNGKLKGTAWQAASAGLIYNREAAKEVLGTDDPAEVQKAVSDWDKYNETAAKVAAAGYTMCSVNDTYRTYSNNVSGKWVQDDKIVIDDNMMKWIDDSKALVDAGAEDTDELWGDDWAKGKRPDGKVFCYFGPAWFFNFCLDVDDPETIAAKGGWGFCEGPQPYFWGGTWICAATGTDNADIVKDIMLKMTADPTVMKEIAIADSECVNNKTVLADLASSDEGNIALLGGQNPYAELAAGAEKIDLSNLSPYDQGCNEELQNNMKAYFEGTADKDACLEQFYAAVIEKYPNLSK